MEPTIARKGPVKFPVEEGKTYHWCTCGKSANQPVCDGSHRGGPFAPMAWTAQETGDVWFCACKHTGSKPLCDGSHKGL
jgi:CDGSH-type Zn-finger protein